MLGPLAQLPVTITIPWYVPWVAGAVVYVSTFVGITIHVTRSRARAVISERKRIKELLTIREDQTWLDLYDACAKANCAILRQIWFGKWIRESLNWLQKLPKLDMVATKAFGEMLAGKDLVGSSERMKKKYAGRLRKSLEILKPFFKVEEPPEKTTTKPEPPAPPADPKVNSYNDHVPLVTDADSDLSSRDVHFDLPSEWWSRIHKIARAKLPGSLINQMMYGEVKLPRLDLGQAIYVAHKIATIAVKASPNSLSTYQLTRNYMDRFVEKYVEDELPKRWKEKVGLSLSRHK